MQVTLVKSQNLGNVQYPAGKQELPDALYANASFKALVKSGGAVVHPRNVEAQKAQASKDARALAKAIGSQANAAATVEERKGLSNNKVVAGAEVDEAPAVVEAVPAAQPVAAQAGPAVSIPAAQAAGKNK